MKHGVFWRVHGAYWRTLRRRTVTPAPAAATLPVCVCPTINFKDTGRLSDTNTACTKDCLQGCQNVKPGGICKIGCQTPLNRTRTNADGSYVCKTTGYVEPSRFPS
jgi:hypothetical protein